MIFQLLRLVFLILLSLPLCTCSSEKAENNEMLARINAYELTLAEYESQLVADVKYTDNFKLTREAKKAFLEQIIRKELLIQEAKKENLDRRAKFIKAIERYWESTLIRDLMELKGTEIQKTTYVTEDDVLRRYEKMKNKDTSLPDLEKIREQIRRDLMDEKKREKLSQWIEGLRKAATIEINEKLLFAD